MSHRYKPDSWDKCEICRQEEDAEPHLRAEISLLTEERDAQDVRICELAAALDLEDIGCFIGWAKQILAARDERIRREVHAEYIRAGGLTVDEADPRIGPTATIEDAEAWLAEQYAAQRKAGALWFKNEVLTRWNNSPFYSIHDCIDDVALDVVNEEVKP
jgi:hypothetical protein